MRAVIYTRARNAHLLHARLTVCQQYAADHGINVDLVLSDLDDGSNLDRPGLTTLRTQATEAGYDLVILYDYFALSRRLDEARSVARELAAAGLRIQFPAP